MKRKVIGLAGLLMLDLLTAQAATDLAGADMTVTSLVGDEVYGGTSTKLYSAYKNLLQGQCLHAKKLELIHPRTQEKMVFECPLPEYMEEIMRRNAPQ